MLYKEDLNKCTQMQNLRVPVMVTYLEYDQNTCSVDFGQGSSQGTTFLIKCCDALSALITCCVKRHYIITKV